MVRNLLEMAVWFAATSVIIGLYMNAVTKVETETVASRDITVQQLMPRE